MSTRTATRRDVLKSGAAGLLGGLLPCGLPAAGRTNPRGTARFAIVIEAAGGMSQADTFDFKENSGTPPDLDVRQVRNGFYLSHRLFPQLSALMDKVSIVRSLRSDEATHFRGQYSLRFGRAWTARQAAEPPPVASIVALELDSQRREADEFPTSVSCNLGPAALPDGFLHPRFSCVDLSGSCGESEIGRDCRLARDLVLGDAGARYIHVRHSGWDHHRDIFRHEAPSNHYRQCNDLDAALARLIGDLDRSPSPRDPAKSLLDETFIAVLSEFGRQPGALNAFGGRHHHNACYSALFAGGGVRGGRIIGRTDAAGERCVDLGWKHKPQPRIENVTASLYSALGIGLPNPPADEIEDLFT